MDKDTVDKTDGLSEIKKVIDRIYKEQGIRIKGLDIDWIRHQKLSGDFSDQIGRISFSLEAER